ncbi:MAG: hypothetical protein P1P87_12485 [Trueperaceae bacterium]|nr:hypothetical protein [Trueperaceae bacterium]
MSPLVPRTAIAAAGAVVGAALAAALLERGWLVGPNNLLYLSVLGLLTGYLVGAHPAATIATAVERLMRRVAQVPPEAVLAAGTGATVALLITVLLNNVLAPVPGFTWYWSLLIAGVLVAAASWFFVVNRHLFAVGRPGAAAVAAEAPPTALPKVLDTSAIIDGRLVEVADAHFLEGPLLVPQFVLAELQRIADAEDPLKRRRGRRGLEVLDRLVAHATIEAEVIHDDVGEGPVDDRLVKLCVQRGAALVTTDFNLHRVAGLQGVRVLNLHQLANAVKAAFLPGERLSLTIVREGREAGQGLAYLEDGTMVVVEDAAPLVGRSIDVTVTSSLQTQMGRMIFGRPSADAGAATDPG